MPSMTAFRAAVVQAGSVIFDQGATLDKVASLTEKAAAGDARLTVFPEAFVSGYPRGVGFGSVVGNRTLEGRDLFRRYWDSSVDVPGTAVDRLAEIAADTSQHLVIGVIEREIGTLYCTVLFFSRRATSASTESWCRPPPSAWFGALGTARHCPCSIPNSEGWEP